MSNLWSGSNIRLDQVGEALQEAKKEGNLHIEYSKIRSFAEAFKKASGWNNQIANYDAGDLVENVCRECNILGRDADEIKKILGC
jgi:hypothetical protein